MNKTLIYVLLGLLLFLLAGCVYNDYDSYNYPPPPPPGHHEHHHYKPEPPRHHPPQYHGEQQYWPPNRQYENGMWPDQPYREKRERTGH